MEVKSQRSLHIYNHSTFSLPKKSGIINIYTMGVSITSMKSPEGEAQVRNIENATSKSDRFFPILAYCTAA